MKPGRLFESPYADLGGVDVVFPTDWVAIGNVLRAVESTAEPVGPV